MALSENLVIFLSCEHMQSFSKPYIFLAASVKNSIGNHDNAIFFYMQKPDILFFMFLLIRVSNPWPSITFFVLQKATVVNNEIVKSIVHLLLEEEKGWKLRVQTRRMPIIATQWFASLLMMFPSACHLLLLNKTKKSTGARISSSSR